MGLELSFQKVGSNYSLHQNYNAFYQAKIQILVSCDLDNQYKEDPLLIINRYVILDISDLRKHTEYKDGYFDLHPVIRLLWQIVGEFSSTEKRSFLKFATGCPKPPLGGFEYLQPPFTIRLVSTDATTGSAGSAAEGANKLVKSFFKLNVNKSGRLPSSSTW